jgi:hypothetical protein
MSAIRHLDQQMASPLRVRSWHRADDFAAAARLSVVEGAADPLTAAIPLPQLTQEKSILAHSQFRWRLRNSRILRLASAAASSLYSSQ